MKYFSERDKEICERYENGDSLSDIGRSFGLSQPGVRYILRRYDYDAMTDKLYIKRYGMTKAEYDLVGDVRGAMQISGKTRATTPIAAYQIHRRHAVKRGIDFNLTFPQWWKIWQDSGKWDKRGRGSGYVMCRKGDEGSYEPGNVYIETGIHNTSTRKGTNSPAIGVVKRNKKFQVRRSIDGKLTYLGSFDTLEEAERAYAEGKRLIYVLILT